MELEILTDEQRKIKKEFLNILFKHLDAFTEEIAKELNCEGSFEINGKIDKFGSLKAAHFIRIQTPKA